MIDLGLTGIVSHLSPDRRTGVLHFFGGNLLDVAGWPVQANQAYNLIALEELIDIGPDVVVIVAALGTLSKLKRHFRGQT
jgi:hypothetical protein